MSTALEAASLIMIPTSYSDGLLASAKPNDGAGDFTFTRGSNISATRVNADGNIEKGYENLLTYSNTFSDAAWLKTRVDMTSGQTGYDGTNDAWLVTNSNDSFPRLEAFTTSSGVSTYSVYVKAGTNSFCQLRTGAISDAWFDLSNGSIISASGTGLIDTNSEEISNGWYRLSLIVNGTLTGVRIYSASAFGVYGLGSIYIQDAMVNQGLVAYPYVETTTATVAAGILEDTPRIDFSGGNQSLLLEPSRTNETPHSEYYDVFLNYGTGKCTFTPNAAISPEGFQNSFKVVLNSNQQNGGGAVSTRMRQFTQGAIITFSMFFKADEFDQVTLGGYFQNESATFNLKDGSVVSQASNVIDAYSISFGNGWYRCVVTYTFQNAIGNGYLYSGFKVLAISDGVSSVGDGVKGLFAYGTQFEEASYPTSYIPTYGVSQTRLEDVCNDAGDVSTFNSTEGVLYAELSFADDNSFKFISLNSGVSTNRVSFYSSSPSAISVNVRNTSGNQFNGNFSIDSTINHKIAVKYKENDFALWIDGQERLIDSSGTTFPPSTLTQLDYDDGNGNSPFNGIVKQMIVFPTALSDEECITLTTI